MNKDSEQIFELSQWLNTQVLVPPAWGEVLLRLTYHDKQLRGIEKTVTIRERPDPKQSNCDKS
jgi:hypothetical protein